MLNEGEVVRWGQPLAGGGVGAVNHFRAGPEGLEGVTGGRPRPVGAGWDPLDPNPMPPGCPYIGVLPSTLTLRDSYPRVTQLISSRHATHDS